MIKLLHIDQFIFRFLVELICIKVYDNRQSKLELQYYLPTSNERIDFIANISMGPCIICSLTFLQSFLYRFFNTGGKFVGFGNQLVYAKNCTEYAWLSNGAFEVVCNHKPLDFHAIFAIAWLLTFTVQVLLIIANLPGFHRVSRKFGAVLGIINIIGMIQLSLWDWFFPMENTPRPSMFTPFMWFICVETLYCLYNGMVAIHKRKFDEHSLWIFRAFIKTFSTPLIRFYPLVLRYFFGTDCMAKNRH